MKLFKSLLSFSLLFFGVLFLDIYFKLNGLQFPYRYFTKAFLILLLATYYFFNVNDAVSNYKNKLTYLGLVLFFVSDILLIKEKDMTLFIIGVTVMLVGKLVYAIRFSNSKDFNMLKLLPLFVICTAYIFFIVLLVYENLGVFFVPILFYLFASLILIVFAYLRKNVVVAKSFYMVGLGVFCFVVCDTYGFLEVFYEESLAYTKFIIMFFYGIAQYLVIVGLTKEKLLDNN